MTITVNGRKGEIPITLLWYRTGLLKYHSTIHKSVKSFLTTPLFKLMHIMETVHRPETAEFGSGQGNGTTAIKWFTASTGQA